MSKIDIFFDADWDTTRLVAKKGDWSPEGYHFKQPHALADGRFIGPVVDNSSQPRLTESRIDTSEITPHLLQGGQAQRRASS